jgi:hypothetical protein
MAQYQRKELAIPSKNHHDDLVSTPPQFFVAQFFRSVRPIRAVAKESIAFTNFTSTTQKLTR